MKFNFQTFDKKTKFIEKAVQKITFLAKNKIDKNEPFKILLSGGSTPCDIYHELRMINTDWSQWKFYYGDERYLPPGHKELNSTMFENTLLNYIPFLKENHFKIDTSQNLQFAANSYNTIVGGEKYFDLALLGIGEDGHTASLFPGNDLGESSMSADVLIVSNSPKPPKERISLSLNKINQSEHIVFLLSGFSKKEILERIKNGEDLPASKVSGMSSTTIFFSKN